MTLEQFKERYEELDRLLLDQRNALVEEYCEANRKYNVGDIISDGNTTIRISKFKWHSRTYNVPVISYSGYVLKKDLTPRKDKEIGFVFQSNVKKHIPYDAK